MNQFSGDSLFFGLIGVSDRKIRRTYCSRGALPDQDIIEVLNAIRWADGNQTAQPGMAAAGQPRPDDDSGPPGLATAGPLTLGWHEQHARGRVALAAALHLTEDYQLGIVIDRPAGSPTPIDAERGKIIRLLPSVGSALIPSWSQTTAREEMVWQTVARTTRRPIVPLDEAGRVFGSVSHAEGLLAGLSGFRIQRRRICASEPDQNHALQEMIEAATAPFDAVAAARAFHRRADKRPIVLAAYPIARSHHDIVPAGAAATLMIAEPSHAAPAMPVALLAEAFGLTRREREVAALLANGEMAAGIAEQLAISAQTVAVHMRNLLAKTGLRRQVDLIRLIDRL